VPTSSDRPFGSPEWQRTNAGRLGIQSTLRYRSIAGVEARALQGDRRRQDLADWTIAYRTIVKDASIATIAVMSAATINLAWI